MWDFKFLEKLVFFAFPLEFVLYFQKFPKKSTSCKNSPPKCWLQKGGGIIQLFNEIFSPNYVFKIFTK
jgi:hypothetical protein